MRCTRVVLGIASVAVLLTGCSEWGRVRGSTIESSELQLAVAVRDSFPTELVVEDEPLLRVIDLDHVAEEHGRTENAVEALADHDLAGLGERGRNHPIDVKLDFPANTADACPMFVGRYVKGVKNGPSRPR